MPRSRQRIPLASTSAASALAVAVEWELTIWKGLHIPGLGLATVAEYEEAWRAYRHIILPAWINAMPGSRPFGAYVAGELPAPPIAQAPRLHGGSRSFGESLWHEAPAYGARDEGELKHLAAIGEADAGESRRARRRLDEHGSRDLYEWQHNRVAGMNFS